MRLLSLSRFIRTFSVSDRLRLIANTFAQVLPIATVQFTIVLLWYYSYGLVGMHLMYDTLHRPTNDTLIIMGNNSTLIANPLLKTEYHMNNYYDIVNYNSFFNMLLTQFHLTIVSNWQVTMKAYMVALDTRWISLYFIVFWLVTVIILMNLVVASVLDIFAIQFQLNRELERFKLQKRTAKQDQQLPNQKSEQEADQFLTMAARASMDHAAVLATQNDSTHSARSSMDSVASTRSHLSLELSRRVSIELAHVQDEIEAQLAQQQHDQHSGDEHSGDD